MRLTTRDYNAISNDFPNIKLSYVKNIHKKVSSADFFLAIPKGPKFFVWFRNFKHQSVCFLLSKQKNRRSYKISIKNCCFNSDLCYNRGTILYGTIVNYNGQSFLFTEDIFYYKNQRCGHCSIADKLNLLSKIFKKETKQVAMRKSDLILGMPIITTQRSDIDNYLNDIPYTLYCVQHRYNNNPCYFNERNTTPKIYKKIFAIRACVQYDIYKLYFLDKHGNLEEHKTALIPNYKSSVMMNGVFRHIKENDNLDLLEESDNEEEFENISDTRFVDLNKTCNFVCIYCDKFKNWIPIKQQKQGEICRKYEILRIEKITTNYF